MMFDTMFKKLLFLCLLSIISSSALMASAPEGLENSLMRVKVTYQKSGVYSPWRWQSPADRSGQGLVVGDGVVLVLASLVKDSTYIEARLNAEPSPSVLKILHVDVDRGIALLQGNLPKDAKVLELPDFSRFERGAKVMSYWKTDGGRFMEGQAVLDRAESSLLKDSYTMQLWYEGSNASVRGGFGEPVFMDGKLLGIGLPNGGGAELSILPIEMIHLRYDLPSGRLKPDTAMAGFVTSPCTSKNLRRLKGVGDRDGGCLITEVMGQGSGSSQLKVGDILLKFAHHDLDAWGRFKDDGLGWLSWEVLLSQMPLGEKPTVEIMRDGQVLSFPLKCSIIEEHQWLIPPHRRGETPDYFIRGGFVFQSMSYSYLQAWGGDWRKKAPDDLILAMDEMGLKVNSEQKQDLVILSQILAHPINMGLENAFLGRKIVTKVNGEPLKSLKQLYDMFEDENMDSLILSLSPNEAPLMLPTQLLKKADADISQWYSINKMLNMSGAK